MNHDYIKLVKIDASINWLHHTCIIHVNPTIMFWYNLQKQTSPKKHICGKKYSIRKVNTVIENDRGGARKIGGS